MLYLFPSSLRYHGNAQRAAPFICRSCEKIQRREAAGRNAMTYEDRTNLIAEFLSANAGKTDETTTRTLNMLVESLAYSKLQELLPDVFKQEPSAPTQPKEKKKRLIPLSKNFETSCCRYVNNKARLGP